MFPDGITQVTATCVVQVLMTRPREEWRHDVLGRYRALEQFSKEDARLQFLRILRSLPYGARQKPPAHALRCGLTPAGRIRVAG